MWYAITWLTAANKDRQHNRTFVTDFQYVTTEINYAMQTYDAYDFQIEETSFEKEFGITEETCRAIEEILNEPDEDPIVDWVEAYEAQQKAETAAWFQAKQLDWMKAAAKKTFWMERGKTISTRRAPVQLSINAEIELAQMNIKRALVQLFNARDNEAIIIMLPNDEALSLTQFKGTRENGYMIGHVFIRVQYKSNTVTKSYYSVKEWLTKMQNMPISALAEMHI